MKHAPNICYRLIILSVANEWASWPRFRPSFFLTSRQWKSRGKKKCIAPRRLASERPEGGTRRRVRHGHGSKGNCGKGTKRGEHRHFFAYERMRRYYRPRARRANCTRNWIPLSRPAGLAYPGDDNAESSPTIGTVSQRYISGLSVLVRKKSPEPSY